jgi:hypothetical protein
MKTVFLALEFDLDDMAPYAIDQQEFEENWAR